jgi:uncharacterized membrane protein
MTRDTTRAGIPVSGWVLAVVSAASFGLSGAVGRGVMDSGWSAAAAVAVRVLVGAAVLIPVAVVQLRGRWHLVRRYLPLMAVYGAVPVAGCQLAYFTAVKHVPVGVALLVEYTAPLAVVGWLWLRQGRRPSADDPGRGGRCAQALPCRLRGGDEACRFAVGSWRRGHRVLLVLYRPGWTLRRRARPQAAARGQAPAALAGVTELVRSGVLPVRLPQLHRRLVDPSRARRHPAAAASYSCGSRTRRLGAASRRSSPCRDPRHAGRSSRPPGRCPPWRCEPRPASPGW